MTDNKQLIPSFLVKSWEEHAPLVKINGVEKRVPTEVLRPLYRLLLDNEIINKNGLVKQIEKVI